MAGASAGASGGGGVAGSGGKGGAGGTAGGGGTAGNGGSGGTGGAPGVLCSAHPIPAKATWVPKAYDFSPGNGMESDPLYNPPAHLIDGLTNKRWSSGKEQMGIEWIAIDFGVTVNLKQITLQVFGNDVDDYPRIWAVRFGPDEDLTKFMTPIIASGVGASGSTVITLPAVATGRYLSIRQTGSAAKWWSVAELLADCTD
jgi:F5/8 type C domain